MLLNFTVLLGLIVFGAFAWRLFGLLRQLNVPPSQIISTPIDNRYRPMLRLLSAEDSNLISANKVMAREFRTQRVRIFREYLRCLTKDYGRLLAGLRLVMVQSETDRPDLARTLTVSKMRFVMAIYEIELRLFMHQAGLGAVNAAGLIEKLDGLRIQVSFALPSLPAVGFSQAR